VKVLKAKIVDLARFRREREAERMREADEIMKKSEQYGMCKKKLENHIIIIVKGN
jgi:hypothetical protein